MTSGGDPRVPRRSAQVVQHSLDDLRTRRRRHHLRRTVLGVALLCALVWGANQLVVGHPVQAALASDANTAGLAIVAHFDRWVVPTTLVLDLKTVGPADTTDLLRGVLLAARDLWSLDILDRVVLARAGTPVFSLTGEDFRRAGRDFTQIRNTVVVLRNLAEALRTPTGQKVPPLDFNDAARRWAAGGR